jgi:hypothetical protein
MPALDDYIDDLFDTYFYHITTPQKWKKSEKKGCDRERMELFR